MDIFGAGLQVFLKKNTGIAPPFRSKFPWLGADLQTLRNSFAKRPVAPMIHKRLLASIEGDKQAINISVTYPEAGTENGKAVLLVHGLGGDEDSYYKVCAANSFLRDGWSVYRMNFREVGPSRETSLPPYSAGLTDDLRAALEAVAEDALDQKIYALGFSLGGQLLLRTLGEGRVTERLAAAATVSAPLNLSNTLKKLQRPRNSVYVNYLVKNMMRDLGAVAANRFGVEPKILTTVWAFDEHVIAPAFGFSGAEDYYKNVSCFPFLDKITTPLLAIHGKDDPWIPWEDYRDACWPVDKVVGAVLLAGGGHVGFHCGATKGVWYQRAVTRFFNKF